MTPRVQSPDIFCDDDKRFLRECLVHVMTKASLQCTTLQQDELTGHSEIVEKVLAVGGEVNGLQEITGLSVGAVALFQMSRMTRPDFQVLSCGSVRETSILLGGLARA